MSVTLSVIEKRLIGVEEAILQLGSALSQILPTSGYDFNMISNSIVEVNNQIEEYKARSVREKRANFFERNETIDYTDIHFLVKRCVPILAESDHCERVVKINNGRHGFGDSYGIDLGNLNLEATINGIDPHNVISHQMTMYLTLEYGYKIEIEETVTTDMETFTYRVPYNKDVLPIAKDRIINWFFDQMELLESSGDWVWYLPTPYVAKDRSQFTVSNRRIHLGTEILRRSRPILSTLTSQLEEGDYENVCFTVTSAIANRIGDFKFVLKLYKDERTNAVKLDVLVRHVNSTSVVPTVVSKEEIEVDAISDDLMYLELDDQFQTLPLWVSATALEIVDQIANMNDAPTNTELTVLDKKYKVTWFSVDKGTE